MERIRKGDEVIVITGKDKGKRGVVLTLVGTSRVMVEGVNVVKKHTRPNPMKNVTGGITDKTMSVDRSNVMLFDPATGKGGRIQIKETDGKRVRVFKGNGNRVGQSSAAKPAKKAGKAKQKAAGVK
jgi:large subunit ribosomal protein L24